MDPCLLGMKHRFGKGLRGLETVKSESSRRRRRASLFEELVLPLLDELYAFSCRLERDPSRAADLLQDALLKGFRKFSQLDDAGSFRSWMATIIRRTFHNRLRGMSPTEQLFEDGSEESPSFDIRCSQPGPDERFAARRLGWELKKALDELPEPQRLAVFLIDAQGYSYGEAARVLEVSPGTVASRVARGRSSLRTRLQHLAWERGWTP